MKARPAQQKNAPRGSGTGSRLALSIIIPALNEESHLGLLLHDLRGLGVAHRVVVVDGGSRDATTRVANQQGAEVLISSRGRGTQLAAGATLADTPWLLFLHADARLGHAALAEVARAITSHGSADAPNALAPAYVFRFGIGVRGIKYRLIERAVHLRTRFFSLPYGDQGLLVRRAEYDAAGGYPSWPLMEDVAIMKALRRLTTIEELRASIQVSARRWQEDGVVRRTWRNWSIMAAYLRGTPPDELAKRYLPSAPPRSSVER